jgi:FKBP-type peptidyl-prolyl cis-trans isomerase 2
MVKKGDFVKVEYTGYDANGSVFDSTSGPIAKQLHGKEGSMLIVLGVDFIVKGMEDALYSMKKGEEREISVPPEKAFGSRTRNRLKIFSINEFHHNEMDPQPGIVVQMETEYGTLNGMVKSVNSGRVLIDFNHPLADQTVKYKVKLDDVIDSAAGKVGELVKDLGMDCTFSVEGEKAQVTLKKGQPEEDLKRARLEIAIKSAVPEIKQVEFKSA